MKKLGVLLAAVFLIAVGAVGGYIYAEKKAEEKFKAKVEKTLAEAGLREKVKVGSYSVSLVKREASLENVKIEPSVKDYGDFLVELKVIKKISFLDYREDPKLKVPTSLKAAFEGIELYIKDKKKGAELPLNLSGLYWLSYQPQEAFLDTSFNLGGNLFEFKEEFALEGIEPSLIEDLRELAETEQVNPLNPKTAFLFSKLLQIKPKKLELRYYDRGFLRSLIEISSENPEEEVKEAVREIEESLKRESSPYLKPIFRGIERALKEGKGGFEVVLVNRGGLSLQDFGALMVSVRTPEELFKILSSKIEVQVREL